MHMTQGSAPISDHRENFDSLPAIFSGDWSEARTSNGGTSGAFMQDGVSSLMVTVVLLGNGLIPPKWRGGACLMAGVYPDPENSRDPIGVPVNPGGGLTPEREGRREIPGREMLNWSGRAGELGGPARAGPISTSLGVSPCTGAE